MINQDKRSQKDLNITKQEGTREGKRVDVGVGHKNPSTAADIEKKAGNKNFQDKR